jgi:hypothetical protein
VKQIEEHGPVKVTVDFPGRTTTATGATLQTYPMDDLPGIPLADGAFAGFSINFNMMVE